ncbi:unnamed protein product [Owenia fusiformis]|uniref:Uncharacterized protein n=1 Tax=Owenia fusiformis TaxID=6347 RepID=A0A8J1U3B8_OWEFU|nr:unnamed protein product [Owenia fusiformis]
MDSNLTTLLPSVSSETPSWTFPRESAIVAGTISSIMAILGTIGNSLTIAAVFKSKRKIAATGAFILNVAIGDLAYCCFCLPFTAVYHFHGFILGTMFCKMFSYIKFTILGAEIFGIALMALNRFFFIVRHETYVVMYTPRGTTLMISVSWLFYAILNLFPLSGVWGRFGWENRVNACSLIRNDSSGFNIFLMLFSFIVPCITMIVCYLWIYATVHTTNNKLRKHSTDLSLLSSHLRKRRDEVKVTKMMAVIFILFLVCYAPYIMTTAFDREVTIPKLHVAVMLIGSSNYCINPLVYWLMNRPLRIAYNSLFPCTRNRTRIKILQAAPSRSQANEDIPDISVYNIQQRPKALEARKEFTNKSMLALAKQPSGDCR